MVLKLGEQGCFYFDGQTRIGQSRVSRWKRATQLPAGDTFNAALAVALTEGQALPGALRFANAAAAISVTRQGRRHRCPCAAEVDALLLKHT